MCEMRQVLILSLFWALIPMLPALLSGGAAGSPHTDLYPSIWGLWAFWSPLSELDSTGLLNHPEGMGWFPSSPIKTLLAGPLLIFLSPAGVHNLLLFAARFAGPLMSYHAARAWGLRETGALTVAAGFGCAAFFHGYAVEGIIEGTDGWTLALWAWAAGRKKRAWMALSLGLCIISSWYLGAACCLLALIASIHERERAWSFLGIVAAAPIIYLFGQAFSGMSPIPDEVRLAMSAKAGLSLPNWLGAENPFAMNNYIGWALMGAALLSRRKVLLWALLPMLLSTGWSLIYSLPVLELMRFPYRWHAATLLIISFAAAHFADQKNIRWLPWLIALEGLALSPVNAVIPGASAETPQIYTAVDGPVLDIPGPFAMPPGEINPSRTRARRFLFAQTQHHQPIAWAPDFNSMQVSEQSELDVWRSWDPLHKGPARSPKMEDIHKLKAMGVRYIVVHRDWLGKNRAGRLSKALETLGTGNPKCDDSQSICVHQVSP